MWGRNVVSLINWTSFFGPHYRRASSSTRLLYPASGVATSANDPAYRTHHSAGTMGHGPFHCITPWLTSLVHMACRLSLRRKPHPRLSFPCTASDDTHQIDFTDWITISVLCVCMFMCWQLCTEGCSWSTVAGLVYIFVLNGAILNLIFK